MLERLIVSAKDPKKDSRLIQTDAAVLTVVGRTPTWTI
jgi:hypothetical protein